MATVTDPDKTTNYTYDDNSNIKTITSAGNLITYTYNEISELIREDNQVLGKTITYRYDAGGNLLEKKEYAYTTGITGSPARTIPYGYADANWKDKLTSFDGKAITYDTIGNPLSYDGWTYTWEEGRQLKTLAKTGTSLSFKYNSSGLRTEKTVNGVPTKYTYLGGKVAFETTGAETIHYTYDGNGAPFSMTYNGSEYFYLRNLQGDVTGLADAAGAAVVNYTYDSWGKLITTTGSLATTLGVKNPYRYRGYRYDTETGLYYLQSRYYNPEIGRFINADDAEVLDAKTEHLSGNNLFMYCVNNPVKYYDVDGYIAVLIPWIEQALLAGAAIIAGFFAYKFMTDPAVKRAISQFVKVFGKSSQSIAQGLVQAVDYSIAKAIKRTPNKNTANHHIVARREPQAKNARDVLYSVHLNVDNGINLVRIKQNLHYHLHTELYFSAVNAIMKPAMNSYSKTVSALNFIRSIINKANAVVP